MGDSGVRLLGDVAVLDHGKARQTRSPRRRTLLALLALRVGQAVDGDLLIDEAWGENLALDPRGTLQIALTRVREWLGETATITASGGHYTLDLERQDVDLLAFLDAADLALQGTDLARYDTIACASARRFGVERHATLLLDAGRVVILEAPAGTGKTAVLRDGGGCCLRAGRHRGGGGRAPSLSA